MDNIWFQSALWMALALIAFQGTPRAGQGELRWLIPPKLLRAIR